MVPVNKTQTAGAAAADTRHRTFAGLTALTVAAMSPFLFRLATLGYNDDRYTHALFVPLISAVFLWAHRQTVLREPVYNRQAGGAVVAIGIGVWAMAALHWIGHPTGVEDYRLALGILALIVTLAGAFILCYGIGCLRRASFPALFLLLMIPLPPSLMDAAVVALQKGSAAVTASLFSVMKVPFLRDGFRFGLPGVKIEVAEECSGIRSTLSFLLGGLLAAELFLQTGWSRLRFILLIVPVVIFKNAIRIATIAWLGVYVDRGFFFGNLHHYGGFPFSMIALAILSLALLLLRHRDTAPA